MSDHTYEFNVAMSCGGCSGAVTRVLTKLDGVKSFDVSLATQLVTVTAGPGLTYDTVLARIARTGKKVQSGAEVGAGGERVARSVEVKPE